MFTWFLLVLPAAVAAIVLFAVVIGARTRVTREEMEANRSDPLFVLYYRQPQLESAALLSLRQIESFNRVMFRENVNDAQEDLLRLCRGTRNLPAMLYAALFWVIFLPTKLWATLVGIDHRRFIPFRPTLAQFSLDVLCGLVVQVKRTRAAAS